MLFFNFLRRTISSRPPSLPWVSYILMTPFLFFLFAFVLPQAIVARSKIRLKFSGLSSQAFAHPLDVVAVTTLQQLPLVEGFTRELATFAEEMYTVDNLARGVLIGPQQVPELYHLLLEASSILDIKEIPDLYIRQNPIPNAYTMAITGKKPFIVVHSGLLDLLAPEELQSVIAHELGHLKCEHGLWITAANILNMGVGQLGGVGGALTPVLETWLLQWRRSAEYSCDRAAVLVAQDWRVVALAFLKLSGGSNSYGTALDLDAFMEQSKKFDDAAKTRGGALVSDIQQTHPLPVLRVRELKKWYESPQYKGLQGRAITMAPQK